MAKIRSPNYPAIGLSDAIQSARDMWAKEKRTAMLPEVAAKALGYRSLNGPARTRLSALKKYGLLEDDRNNMRLSELALRIVHQPEGSADYQKAIQEAALTPEIFRELWGSHADASDDALRSLLIIQRKFSDEGARQFIRAFRDTLAIAKLKDSGHNDGGSDGETDGMLDGDPSRLPAGGKPIVRVLSFMLSKDVTAEVRLVGEALKPVHLEGLVEHLQLTKKSWERDEA